MMLSKLIWIGKKEIKNGTVGGSSDMMFKEYCLDLSGHYLVTNKFIYLLTLEVSCEIVRCGSCKMIFRFMMRTDGVRAPRHVTMTSNNAAPYSHSGASLGWADQRAPMGLAGVWTPRWGRRTRGRGGGIVFHNFDIDYVSPPGLELGCLSAKLIIDGMGKP